MNILALVTDAHGGFGGISQYNRDALEAMASFPTVAEVRVLPRLSTGNTGPLPDKLHYELGGLGGRIRYTLAVMRAAKRMRHVDLIYCAHVNLIPVARIISNTFNVPIVLAVYGLDVWQLPGRINSSSLRLCVSAVISISEITRERFQAWCSFPTEKIFIVPNAIRLEDYGEKSRNPDLIDKYGLAGKTVLMTLGRMASEERAKGFDEIIELLPQLIAAVPNVVYLAAGDGDDRARLEKKVAGLGLNNHVVFTGRIDDAIKADVYRLADVYVMPSRGEGFGFVVLEALASGVPVVASTADGTREAVRDGALGILVDPSNPQAVLRGILEALKQPRGVPPGLEFFSYDRFADRLKAALRHVCAV